MVWSNYNNLGIGCVSKKKKKIIKQNYAWKMFLN